MCREAGEHIGKQVSVWGGGLVYRKADEHIGRQVTV